VGKGKLVTTFFPDDSTQTPLIVDGRTLTDDMNMAVIYHNPLDNVDKMANIFFDRCLLNKVTPFIVTKKTVFKWQEEFWKIMKTEFDKNWREKFNKQHILDK